MITYCNCCEQFSQYSHRIEIQDTKTKYLTRYIRDSNTPKNKNQ